MLGSLVSVRSKHRGMVKGVVIRKADNDGWIVKPLFGQGPPHIAPLNILADEMDMKVINAAG